MAQGEGRALKVLLTDATSYKAAVIARFLHENYPAVDVVTCDPRPLSRWLVTKHRTRHHVLRRRPADGAAYVSELRDLVQREAVDLLLPVNSAEMDPLLAARAELGGALSYWGDLDAFRRLDTKDAALELARSCGVAVPEVFASAEAAHPPVVAKPARSSAARGVRYLATRAQLDAFRPPPGQPYVYQAYAAGQGAGYSVFSSEGRVLHGFGHRRLAEYPTSGGSSVYRETCEHAGMADAARRLVEATRWSGFAMFEFKLTADGTAVLLEVNPRIWGSIHQGLAAGVNYFESLFGPAAPRARPDARTYLSPLLYLSLLRYAAAGNLAPLAAFLGGLPRNRADVPVSDPGAWLGSLLRAV